MTRKSFSLEPGKKKIPAIWRPGVSWQAAGELLDTQNDKGIFTFIILWNRFWPSCGLDCLGGCRRAAGHPQWPGNPSLYNGGRRCPGHLAVCGLLGGCRQAAGHPRQVLPCLAPVPAQSRTLQRLPLGRQARGTGGPFVVAAHRVLSGLRGCPRLP